MYLVKNQVNLKEFNPIWNYSRIIYIFLNRATPCPTRDLNNLSMAMPKPSSLWKLTTKYNFTSNHKTVNNFVIKRALSMSITGPTFVFTILLEQQLKLCMCSSAEWTSNNLLNINGLECSTCSGTTWIQAWRQWNPPPPPITQSQKNKLPFTMTTAMERDIDK